MRKIIVLILAIVFMHTAAKCCSCMGKGKMTVFDFNSYDDIFIGTLISQVITNEKDYSCRRLARYRVTKAYKGVNEGDTVNVYDAEDGGACGLQTLMPGRQYLIYTYIYNKKRLTNDCSRTTRMPIQYWPQDSLVINRMKNLDYFSRIYDTTRTNFHADTMFLNPLLYKISKDGYKKFYDAKGRLSAHGKYINGVPEGFWSYYEHDTISDQGKYVAGKKDSLWIESMYGGYRLKEYKLGEFTKRVATYFDNEIYDKTEPVGEGAQWVHVIYHTPKQPRYVRYCKPPERDSNGLLQEPVSHGSFKMFNRKGIALNIGIYDNGEKVGVWKYYYGDGKIRMEGKHTIGQKSGTWKIYYPNGQIKAVGEYKNDKKVGVWKYYNEVGKEIPPDPIIIEKDEDILTYTGAFD